MIAYLIKGDTMNRIFLINYIKRLTRQDIINFSVKQNIPLTDQEVEVIYTYIKTRYRDVFNGHGEEVLAEIKGQVSPNTYEKILEYYNLYYDKF